MARSQEAAGLTARHRDAQLAVRASAVRDYLRLWPLWTGDDRSFNQLVAATIPLLESYYRLSSSLATGYYDTFRRAEQAGGTPTPRVAPGLDRDSTVASLVVTGRIMTRKALQAGDDPHTAMQTALIRTSGTVTRFVLQGGRDTLVRSARDDGAALGWSRVTAADPCAFCAMLASRGPVYHGKDSADFDAHDHCACMAEPTYEGSDWPGRAREFKRLYDKAQREARAADELHRGTANDALNAFRRLLKQP